MNKTAYFQFQNKFFNDLMELTKRKSADYCGSETDDPFANFKLAEKLRICTVEQGMLVRMSDKMARAVALIDQEPHVLGESLTDTLMDLAGYSALLAGYLASTRKKPAWVEPVKPSATVWQVVALGRYSKTRTTLGTFLDKETAEVMLAAHYSDIWPTDNFNLTVEEIPGDDQHSQTA